MYYSTMVMDANNRYMTAMSCDMAANAGYMQLLYGQLKEEKRRLEEDYYTLCHMYNQLVREMHKQEEQSMIATQVCSNNMNVLYVEPYSEPYLTPTNV